ncbi:MULTISPECIES: DUF317 domain-containing protein [unclassified Streptomyces]|uniref:DUF317 domain-containing protein n=1 Tax=unclassified Streptomyces TaxID=2593676 RepID=UPI00403CBEBF
MKTTQWAGWGPGEQPEQHYLIEPRALAGGGDIRHVSEYLRASGWRVRSKKDGPLMMESPDRTVRVSYDPYVQPGGWTIHGAAQGHRDEWWAALGQQTPVEIVAGLTDLLAQPPSAHAPNVWAPLMEQHWRVQPEGQRYTATSADESAWLHFRQDAPGDALWWAGGGDRRGITWSAQFAPTTPMHLVQAFAAALASPQPVMRPRGRVPYHPKIRTTSVSVLPSQLSAWQQARITAARAAAWARTWNTGRPRTAARPHTPVGGNRARR